MSFRRNPRQFWRQLLALTLLPTLLLSLIGVASSNPAPGQVSRLSLPLIQTAPAPPPPPPPPPPQVDIWVQLGSSSLARPGERVRLNIFMRNVGSVDAGAITLRVPFNTGLANFFTYHIDSAGGDRFLGVSNGNNVGLAVNRRIAPGQTHQVSLWFTLRNDASEGAIFRLSSDYQFGAVVGRTNQTNVTILRGGELTGGFCGPFRGVNGRFSISPESGPRGTRFIFSSDCFLPGEEVVTWLNVAPGIVRPLELRARADGGGRVVFQLDSNTLLPGDTYGLVGSGLTSRLQILGPFIVTGGIRSADLASVGTPTIVQLPSSTAAAEVPVTASQPAQDATGGVTGVITGDEAAPLNEVIVTVFNPAREIVDAVRSDADGRYTLSGLGDGTYTLGLLASLSGDPTTARYASQLFLLTIADGLVTTLDANLTRGGAISGQIVGADAGNPPLEGVTVFIYGQDDILAGIALSDASGVYTSTALLSGTYRVEIDPTRSLVAATTNYVGTTLEANVTAPATTADVNATLAVGGASVQLGGQVTAQESGLPLANITIAVLDADTNAVLAFTTTNFAGVYQTAPLSPGRFRVYAITTRTDSELAQRYSSTVFTEVVEQSNGGRNDVNFALALGTQVSGTVSSADASAPLEGVTVSILTEDGLILAITESDADGAFRVPAVPNGTYTLRFSTANSDDANTRSYQGSSQPITITDSPAPRIGIVVQLAPESSPMLRRE
jgi:hypothetical protein